MYVQYLVWQPMRFVEVLFDLMLILGSHICCRLSFQLLLCQLLIGALCCVNVVDTDDLYTSLEELMRQFACLNAFFMIQCELEPVCL